MRRLMILALALMPGLVEAGVLAAARTLPAGTVITAGRRAAISTSRAAIGRVSRSS